MNHQLQPQRGVAALSVVMVLFFIVAMVAAYTNRNLVFEQRTSANSYRSARSLAAADAAVDWTIAKLNGDVIGTACNTTDADASDDFRTRYLSLLADGKFAPKTYAAPIFAGNPLVTKTALQIQPACSGIKGGGLSCSCPTVQPPAMLDVSNKEQPTFTVAFEEESAKGAGVLGMKILGCTSMRSGSVTSGNVNSFGSCHINDLQSKQGPIQKSYLQVDAFTMLSISLGLVSALPVPPSAALTVVGAVDQTAGTLTAINSDPMTGLAVHSGAAIPNPGNIKAYGPAGSTANVVSPADTDLITTDFFRKSLGLPVDRYKEQPASVRLACSSGCGALDSVLPKLQKGPTRIIFVDGDLDLDVDDAIAIGSDSTPAMVVVNGNLKVSKSISFKGILFVVGNLTWQAPKGVVSGAVVVGGTYSGTGTPAITYDREVVRRIHQSYGSFVRVPGTWVLDVE